MEINETMDMNNFTFFEKEYSHIPLNINKYIYGGARSWLFNNF